MIMRQTMQAALQSMGYYTSARGGAPAPHLVVRGRLLFELITVGGVYAPDSDRLCPPGWVFVHRPGENTVWRAELEGHYECLTATFDVAHITRPESWPRMFQWQDAEAAVTFAHEMLHAFHHTAVDREIIGDVVWSRLRFQLDHFKRQESRRDIPPRVSAVMAYIDKHFAEAPSIDVLADHVGMSASHLHARFRQFVAMTPHQYVIRRRMRSARHRLATTMVPIKSIASEVGYANTESFCRAFKQHFKTTAAIYRKTYMIYR
jgi:AraC-like DNA-binding protein